MASILDRIMRPFGVAQRIATSAPVVPTALVTPNQSSYLPMVAFSEFFAGEIGQVNRQSAMQIPAIKRGRDIIATNVAGLALKQFRADVDVTPAWLTNSASGVSPYHRMVGTVDDILFYDWCAWAVSRASDGAITDALRIPFERWQVQDDGRVIVDGSAVSAEEVVLIPGNGSGGILMNGAQTIKGFKAMERAWVGRVQNPIPLIELHQDTDDPLTDGGDDGEEENEIARLINDWSVARSSPNGAVGYTPSNISLRVHGAINHELFVEGRNAAVLDVARLIGIPGSILDGSMATASLTYSTAEGKRSEFDLYSTPLYIDPIEARLSMDDVAPAGEVIRFDRTPRVSVDAPAIRQPVED